MDPGEKRATELIEMYEDDRIRLIQKIGAMSAIVDAARKMCDEHGPDVVCLFCKFFRPENIPVRPRASAGQEGEI